MNINNQQLDSYRYEYDGSNRIIEDIYDDSVYDSSFNIKYSYDSNGNIFTKDILSKVEKYTYEYDTANPFLLRKIKLTKNNSESVFTELSYDSNNPLIINQIIRNNETININYQNGFITTIGSTAFEYNHLGQRIVKYDNENVTYYYYDDNNQLLGLKLNNEIYLYDRDILGNITGIIDKTGKLMIKFTYTAFGEPIINIPSTLSDDECIIVDQIVANNIFLYKGYVYDVETQLYWVSSRYYSPELCRFIQPADVSSLNPSSINGFNLFSYANNNPVACSYGGFESSIMMFGKGHQGNMRSSKYTYWTTEELLERLKELSRKGHLTAKEKEEKKEIEKELKARGERNRAKRKGYVHSHFSLSTSISNVVSTPSIGVNDNHFISFPNVNIDEDALAATGALLVVGGLITYVMANDVTGFGVADDWALLLLIPLFFLLGGER